ncbi:MAG: hypothetical protein ABIP49_08720 [Lysobacterales bacterium]
MNSAFWSRRVHKWIAWAVGAQALLWMASGLYMTAISIDIIHGDHLVKVDARPLAPAGVLMTSDQLIEQHPGVHTFRLKRFMGREVYELHDRQGIQLIDARSGARLSPLDEAAARQLAIRFYKGNAPVHAVEWLEKAPQEVSTRPVPLWQVSFADRNETTLYLSPHTGELLAKRHDLWRWFDFLWMLHIMDYDTRDDINNRLLQVASWLGLAFSLSGVWLLFYSFRRRVRV